MTAARSRRSFLASGAALGVALGGAALLGACGDDDGSPDGDGGQSGGRPDDLTGSTVDSKEGGGPGTQRSRDGFTLVQRFPSTILVPGVSRLPISIASGGTLQATGPATLRGKVVDIDGKTVISDVSARRRSSGIVTAYWPFRVTLEEPGFYTLLVDGADDAGAAFQISEPANVSVPYPGVALRPFDTPTTADPRGVDPICTRSPDVCPFHEVTLAKALAARKPVVYLVGTPAHCQTGTCAPGLEFLVSAARTYGSKATFVHAEVYSDAAATEVAPAVLDAGLDYEPVVFVTDATGSVVERIDAIWDGEELGEVLKAALG